MAVKYRASTLTNLDSDNSKIDYMKPALDDSKFQHSVQSLRNNPFGVATLFLGVLCVLLLFGVIGQSVHYRKVDQDRQDKLTTLSKDKENLQEKLKTEQTAEKEVDAGCSQLSGNNFFLSRKTQQLQTNSMILSEETSSLRATQSQLEASHASLSKEAEQLRASKTQLQSTNSALMTEKDMLQKEYDADLKQKNELHASYESVSKERDILQNSFTNVSRSKDELQKSYLKLIQNLEQLQERHNFSFIEKGKLDAHHQGLTDQLLKLKGDYQALKVQEGVLSQNVSKASSPSNGTECNNQTEEREKLQKTNDVLTEERDRLQGEYDRLNATVYGKVCPIGWVKFENNCYFNHSGPRTWNQARETCHTWGAELAIIKTQQEMDFINGLFRRSTEAWIGLTDIIVEGRWRWVDGTRLTRKFWAKGKPDSRKGVNKDCAEFWHRGSEKGVWNDEECAHHQQFICEM